MRVTHIITRLVVGGAQENTVATVLGLQSRPGLNVDLISGPTFGSEGSLESSFADRPALLTIVPSLVRPVHPFKDWRAIRHLTALLRKRRPDIVHTHSGKAGVLGRLAAHHAQVPVVIHHIHGPSFGPFQGPLSNLLFRVAEQYVGRFTTHFFCSADAMTQRYLAAGIARPEMYTRIFSGFRVEPFLQAENDPVLRARLGVPLDAFVIGKIGRIAPLKGHHDLLTATKSFLHQHPNARVLVVGDGPMRAEIEQRARALGIADKTIFTGLLPPSEIPRHLGIMDCLVHLSSREAVSRVLPQALAAAKPVLAYDFDGANEVCQHGQSGFIVPIGDVPAVTRYLLQFAADRRLREKFGHAGREFVAKHFRVEQMIEQQYQLYIQLNSASACLRAASV